MKKIWLIAKTTYRQRVTSGMFLILTFAIPVLMVVAGAIGYFSSGFGSELPVIGFVDQTGELQTPEEVPVEDRTLQVQVYDTIENAADAFQSEEISGYLVIPEGYFGGEQALYYAEEAPNEFLTQAMTALMRQAMLSDAPAWVLERLTDTTNRSFVGLNENETMEEGPERVIQVATPIGLGILLALALLFTSNQMGAAVVKEKDQRAMEMIVTSINPMQLVAGKVLGMSLLSLTQMAVWGIGIVIGAFMLLFGEITFTDLTIPWNAFFWALLLGFPGYFMYAVIASGLGIIAGDTQQAQQLAGFLGFFGMVPLWFIGLLIDTPNSAAAIGLTLFPLTAPIFSLIRMGLTEVPVWQLILSFGIIMLTLLAGVWLVARLFRAAMLIYGKALSPREIIRAIRLS